jgi:hypothetical protein
MADEPVRGPAARDPFIAGWDTGALLPLRAVRDAKRKPLASVERRLDDRSWVKGVMPISA